MQRAFAGKHIESARLESDANLAILASVIDPRSCDSFGGTEEVPLKAQC
jgi:hypothetical protein